ncbi:hypothetical protein QU487_16675 [Crenobacter sp. SG2305]|uniref:hypothetical protein n=1 Tax=Crenobacter oryzisoli TaxID=3056844 RepID=UPI0025AA5FA8|nr:hypothetical protein [Crenobacter sp. SG2305]MDN0084373.1 hypothetical protein [Crenobacter sp. SG2305]
MFNPELSAQQFLLLLTALVALFAGYQLHARLLPWLRVWRQRRRNGLRHFAPHPYMNQLATRNETASPHHDHHHG